VCHLRPSCRVSVTELPRNCVGLTVERKRLGFEHDVLAVGRLPISDPDLGITREILAEPGDSFVCNTPSMERDDIFVRRSG